MTTTISRQALLAYIEKEQIAFQFWDGLITFTQPETGVYDDAHDEAEVNDMNNAIEQSYSLKVVTPEDVIDYSGQYIGFNEFARWSQLKDLLILVDDSLLLCLPNYENYNEIFELVA